MTDNRAKKQYKDYIITEAGFSENQRYIMRTKKALEYIEANQENASDEEVTIEFGNMLGFAAMAAVSPVLTMDSFLSLPAADCEALMQAVWELNPEWRTAISDQEKEKKSAGE